MAVDTLKSIILFIWMMSISRSESNCIPLLLRSITHASILLAPAMVWYPLLMISCAKFFLWNPSIRKFLAIPEPSHTFKTCSTFEAALQFGHDPRTDDYKIVRMNSFPGCHPEIEIFSINSGSWKGVSGIRSAHSGDAGSFPAFVNGNLHWLAYKKREDAAGQQNVVLAFDVGDEAFTELMFPATLADAALGMMSIMAYRESSIAVVHYDTYSYEKSQHKCHIWVMKKYGDAGSRIKLFSSGIQGEDLPRIKGFQKNGHILAEMDEDLVSVDPRGFRVKHLGIQIKKGLDSLLFDPTATYGDGDYATPPPLYSPPVADIAFLDTHVESLVLLDKRKNEGDLNDINDEVLGITKGFILENKCCWVCKGSLLG